MASKENTTDDNWYINPLGVMVGDDYKTYEAALSAQLDTVIGSKGQGASKIAEDKGANFGDGKYAITDNTAYSYNAPSVSDATVGGNDVINPLSAFNEDDDIVHQLFKTGSGTFGMGRVYSEIYDSRQQVLYLTMGIPKYRNLQTWLKNAARKEIAELNEEGKISTWSKLGDLITGGIKLAIALPWLPAIWSYKVITGIKNYPVTEYFMFRDTMPLYYRYVNTLLAHISTNLGIASANGGGTNGQATPEIIKYGLDIFKIICKRSSRLGKATSEDTDKLLKAVADYKDDPEQKHSMWSNFWSGITTGALEGGNFLGFRVDKVEAAESFSNSTQESSLAGKLNSEVQAYRDRNTGEANGEGLMAKARKWGAQAQSAISAAKKLVSGGGLESAIAYMAAGNGYFDLPKQWGGSGGMSRSMTFSMKLRARTGGDNVSIYQSIMIPLACLLAAALPRATGDSTYTSPFIVRAFCKGMFAIPAGIISTLSVTRGSSEYGWSILKVPTTVDISFSIEDLSPMLFLSMGGDSVFMQAFSNNTKMHEYLTTLTGIGLKERYYRLGQLKRQLAATALVLRNTTFSATYRGYVIGDSSIVRSIMALTPFTRVKNN